MQPTAHLPHHGFAVSTFLLLGLAASPLVAGCSRSSQGAGPETQATGGARQREVPKVRTIEIEHREMTQVLETMTKLESELEIELFPLTAGTVVEVLAEEGDHVRTGDVLAKFDDRDQVLNARDAQVALDEANNAAALAKLAVEEAKARMDSAELSAKQAVRDHERNLSLFEGLDATSPVSKSALEASELARDRADHDYRLAALAWEKSKLDDKASSTAVERAKVGADRAAVALSHCALIAPFDGIIAERHIRVGNSASAATAAYVLTDPENLRAVFRRPQEELPMFHGSANGNGGAALAVTATAEALPGERFRGEVVRVSPTIDRDSGQFRVTARLQPEEEGDGSSRLLPGMLVRLEIVTDRHSDALAVPKRALRREGERRYLFVVEPADKRPTVAPTETGETPGEIPEGATNESGEVKSLAARDDSVRTIRRVDIQEGYSDDEYIEVKALDGAPLTEDTVIVLVGSRDLDDGDLVDIGSEDEPPLADPSPDEQREEVADTGTTTEGTEER